MVIMTFRQALAVAQAVLFFGSSSAARIQVAGRAISNTTKTSQSSHPITSPPSTSTSTSTSSLLNWCSSTDDIWVNCDNSALGWDANGWEGTAVGFFDPTNNPYNTESYPDNIVPANPSVASYCGSLWSSSAAAFWATDPVTAYTASGDTGTNETLFVNTFSWQATATQCCLNCTIQGGAIQVMVWPTPPPVPAVTTLVDRAANFTFVSPSVYVVFESIAATNLCGEVGTTIINKTIAFDPEDLSTQRNYFAATTGSISNLELNEDYCTHATPIPDDWSTFDYKAAEAGVCTDITTSWWTYYASNDTTMYSDYSDWTAAATADVSCGFGCLGQPIESFTCLYNPCSPFVSVPTQVYNLDPEYNTCINGIKAFFDPPYTLTAGGGLVAFSSTPVSSATASPQSALASPTPTPTPATPTPTPTPTPFTSPIVVESETSTSSTPVEVSSSAPADPGTSDTQPIDPSTSSQAAADPGSTQASADSQTSIQATNPGKSSQIPQASTPSQPIATIGSLTASQVSSNIVIGGSGSSQTLTPGGGAVTIGGTMFSLDPSSSLVIDGSTTAIAVQTTPTPIGILTTTNGQTGLVVGSQTITPGAPAITISGTTISLASSGNIVVVNGATSSLAPETPAPSLITTSGSTLLLVGSQTILPGSSAVTVDGTTYSLAPSGNALVVDGTSQYLLASQTLVAGGPAITVSGTVVSLQSGGQSVVIGSSTEAIGSFVAGATSSGLGGAIVSIGGFASGSSGAPGAATTTGFDGTVFTGAASKIRGEGVGFVWVLSLLVWNWVL